MARARARARARVRVYSAGVYSARVRVYSAGHTSYGQKPCVSFVNLSKVWL